MAPRLSKYVMKLNYQGDVYLFNTNGGGLIKLSSGNSIQGEIIDEKSFDSKELRCLYEMKFVVSDEDDEKPLLRIASKLSITIEVTGRCNFACEYCYQQGWKQRNSIASNVIDEIILYVKNAITEYNPKLLKLSFIGGEPLLESTKILFIYSAIRKICAEVGINLQVDIDTNGTLLTREFLQSFSTPLRLSVSLTKIDDHDKMRHYINGNGSYYDIINKLKACNDLFADKVSLDIRYNVNQNNIHAFPSFLQELRSYSLNVSYVNPMYTREIEGCDFRNKLSFDDYLNWHSTLAIDALIENDFHVNFFPQVYLVLCKAYQPYSCKIFSDGKLGLCDAFEYANARSYIGDVSSNPSKINDIFSEYKHFSPLQDDNCRNCRKIFLCGGKYFCKPSFCDEQLYNIEKFMLTFIKYAIKGKSSFFDIFN